jgi:hypothetical protein
MSHAALALAAVVGFPSGLLSPAAPTPSAPACAAAEIDPSFVHYVPPAVSAKGGNPLFLLISLGQQEGFRPRAGFGCVRAIQVRDDR